MRPSLCRSNFGSHRSGRPDSQPRHSRFAARPALIGLLVTAALVSGLLDRVGGAESQRTRVHVTIDKSQILTMPGQRLTKVAVTNPKIADVHVLSPSQLLIHARAVGETSLAVFLANGARFFDLVVDAAPVVGGPIPVPAPEPHTILIHRADKLSTQHFVRDGDQIWIELGSVNPETDAPRK